MPEVSSSPDGPSSLKRNTCVIQLAEPPVLQAFSFFYQFHPSGFSMHSFKENFSNFRSWINLEMFFRKTLQLEGQKLHSHWALQCTQSQRFASSLVHFGKLNNKSNEN
ncbi:glucan synthase-like 9 [Striga asiatica]|uniref:Glucan synthase-like 9 n=1 Tax=Striga asiatica TaxID=4170 RepID=A0A5A7P4L7_STRAF|nr:glucan synthase-like 9 [Striga asiatica]